MFKKSGVEKRLRKISKQEAESVRLLEKQEEQFENVKTKQIDPSTQKRWAHNYFMRSINYYLLFYFTFSLQPSTWNLI